MFAFASPLSWQATCMCQTLSAGSWMSSYLGSRTPSCRLLLDLRWDFTLLGSSSERACSHCLFEDRYSALRLVSLEVSTSKKIRSKSWCGLCRSVISLQLCRGEESCSCCCRRFWQWLLSGWELQSDSWLSSRSHTRILSPQRSGTRWKAQALHRATRNLELVSPRHTLIYLRWRWCRFLSWSSAWMEEQASNPCTTPLGVCSRSQVH